MAKVAKEASVFAKLSPQQKARIVTTLRNSGNSVGYMGDGINDAAAMKSSDVGISVDSAVAVSYTHLKLKIIKSCHKPFTALIYQFSACIQVLQLAEH